MKAENLQRSSHWKDTRAALYSREIRKHSDDHFTRQARAQAARSRREDPGCLITVADETESLLLVITVSPISVSCDDNSRNPRRLPSIIKTIATKVIACYLLSRRCTNAFPSTSARQLNAAIHGREKSRTSEFTTLLAPQLHL